MGEPFDEGETDAALEVEDEPPICPTSLEVDKAVEVLQQLTLFCENVNEMREIVEKINVHAQREISKRRKVPSMISLPNSKRLKTLLTLYFIALKDRHDLQKLFFLCFILLYMQEYKDKDNELTISGQMRQNLRFLRKLV